MIMLTFKARHRSSISFPRMNIVSESDQYIKSSSVACNNARSRVKKDTACGVYSERRASRQLPMCAALLIRLLRFRGSFRRAFPV